ncbi:MAG: hypothetical protein U0992_12545 [Planctomycetaceae bacterium]
MRSRAFDMLGASRLHAAFDIGSESPEKRAAYARSVLSERVAGARRLVEAGVPIVQINWRAVATAVSTRTTTTSTTAKGTCCRNTTRASRNC